VRCFGIKRAKKGQKTPEYGPKFNKIQGSLSFDCLPVNSLQGFENMGGGVGGVPTPSRKFPPTTPISYCAPMEVNSPQPSVVRTDSVIRIPAGVEAEGRAIPGSRSGSWGDRAMSEVHESARHRWKACNESLQMSRKSRTGLTRFMLSQVPKSEGPGAPSTW
jgi:hypothetical protein